MRNKKLTDRFVERAKPPKRGRVEYFDAAFPGLALRITESGSKSWCAFYRYKGRLRRLTLGRYPTIKPAQARKEASAALERLSQGIDPAEEKRARRDMRTPETDTFGAVVQDYLDRHLSKNNAASTYHEAKRDLDHDALPKWRNRPMASIGRRDVIDLIDRIVERGAEIQANRTFARLRALFNWAIEKDRLILSPLARMKAPTKERTRERALSEDEIRWFWQGCEEIGWPFGHLFKLLLLTAQRRSEVAGIAWSEIDTENQSWTIPRNKTKSDRGHEVHLSDQSVELLLQAPRIANRQAEATLVFTVTGDTPVSGFSRAKRRLDDAMRGARRRSLGLPENDRELRKYLRIPVNKPLPEISDWRLHDLRRTAATGMARMNVPPHVVEKVLNHSSGTIRGVARVYNRFEYLEQRREALEAWGAYVTRLVQPTKSNIVKFKG